MKYNTLLRKYPCFEICPMAVSLLLISCILFQTVLGQTTNNFPRCNGDKCPKEKGENGIVVGQTKLYDEKSFRIMLQNLEQGLSGLKLINEGILTGNYGRIQGARLSTSSFGVNVTGMPIPSVATTTATGVTNTSNVVTTQSDTPSTVTTLNTLSPNTTQQVVTDSSVNPAIPNLPTQTSAYSAQPSAPMSQDLLAEQVSLQYQVMDLRLLLERSLTDRVFSVKDGEKTLFGQKSSAIVGFNVTIDTKPEYKDAVAEVEIVIASETEAKIKSTSDKINPAQNPGQNPGQNPAQNPGQNPGQSPTQDPGQPQIQSANDGNNEISGEKKPPSLVMLLPRDKTYNVTAATKDAKQIGLGAVLQVVNVGVSAGKTNESLYIVGDTDTVAFERTSLNTKAEIKIPDNAIAYGWQFRPVLGQRSIKPGMRQLYALLALPDDSNTYKGKVTVFTRWRKYDAKTKIVKDIIEGSETYKTLEDLNVQASAVTKLAPSAFGLNWEDVGNGKILLNVRGENYLDGISVLTGDKMISTAADGLTVQGDSNLTLLMPSQTAAQISNAWLIGRYGAPKPLIALPSGSEENEPGWGLKIESVQAKPISAQNSQVEVVLIGRNTNLNEKGDIIDKNKELRPPSLFAYIGSKDGKNLFNPIDIKPIVIVGGKAFGFSDAPLLKETLNEKHKLKYSFVAPTQLLKDARKLTVKELFQQASYTDEKTIEWLPAFRPSQPSVLFSNGSTISLAIGGGTFNRCQQIIVSIGGGTFVYQPDADLFKGEKTEDRICKTAPPPSYSGTKAGDIEWKSPSLLTLSMVPDYFKGAKNLLVSQSGEDPVMVALAVAPEVPEPVVDKQDKVSVGMIKTVKLTGTNFVSISDVTFQGESLKPVSNDAGTALEITLNSTLTANPGEKQINFVLKNGKVKNYILVVDARN